MNQPLLEELSTTEPEILCCFSVSLRGFVHQAKNLPDLLRSDNLGDGRDGGLVHVRPEQLESGPGEEEGPLLVAHLQHHHPHHPMHHAWWEEVAH